MQASPVGPKGDGSPGPKATPERRDDGGRSPKARQARRLHILRWVLEIVVLAGGAVFVLRRVGNVGQLATTFGSLRWHWLLVGVAAEAGSITALSWLQQRLLRVGDLAVRTRDLLPVTMASNAVAQALPAGTLFAEGYAFRQYQRLGASRVLGVWAELSAGALASAGLAAVAVAGAAVVGPGLRLKLLPVLSFVLAGALVAAFLFQRAPLLSRLIRSAFGWAQHVLPPKACGQLERAGQATQKMAAFRPSTRLWLLCLLAAAVNWGLDALVLTCGLLAVGGPVPWRGVLLCYAAVQLLVELPITPGGLGLVEGGLVELLSRFHVPASQATAATLVYRALSYWLLLAVGWVAVSWLAVHNRRAERASAQEVPGAPPQAPAPAS
jgi:putative heme transporter